MNCHIVSGYFSHFHQGHKEYIKSVIDKMEPKDSLVIIVPNENQYKLKYVSFSQKPWQTIEPINKWFEENGYVQPFFEISRDRDTSVKETLKYIKEWYLGEKFIFYKDAGEYNLENLPEKDVKGIDFVFLTNKKIGQSGEDKR